MLDDGAFDAEGCQAGEIATEFAHAEGSALVTVNGNSNNSKPKDFLTYMVTNESDATRAFCSLQYIVSGETRGFAVSNQQNKLVDLA